MKTFIRTSLGLGLLALILAACNISPTPGERPQIRTMEDHLEVESEIAWIPNSSEGTVSKVDVEAGDALARYQTVDPNGAEPGDDELFWQRTSRVAVDADGNAYVLNVASHGPAPMQGSLARVMAEGAEGEDPTTTSQNHDDVLDFGDDVRVTHWNIGDVGDMPRTVAVVGDSLWVGFYGSSEVREYDLADLAGDSGVENPEPTVQQTVDVSPLTPYSHAGAVDSEGNMYFISRDAFPAGVAGLGVVDTSDGSFTNIDISGGTANPYSLLVDGDDHVWFSDAGNWGQNITRYLGQYDPVADVVIHHSLGAHIQMRGMTLDGDGNIWITRDDDKVVRATIDHDDKTVTDVDTFDVTPSGQPTVGIAGDSAGNLWVIQRNDGDAPGFLVKLDSEGNLVTETIEVGLAPYAYGAFVTFEEPPEIVLEVSKTANTSFTRIHDWSIEKSVDTEKGHELDDVAKIWLYADGTGDETATWTVDVTYEGYTDSDFQISGDITIENLGETTATIESVTDDLGIDGFDDIALECQVDDAEAIEFPFELEAGHTIICTYSESVDAQAGDEGTNTATVAVEGEEDITATDDWAFDEPTTELYATVGVVDVSDLLGTVVLSPVGGLSAADYTEGDTETFPYTHDFAWADYGQEKCGDHPYDNTASVLGFDGTERVVLDSASATLKVNVQCLVFDGETAWAANAHEPGELRYTQRGNWATYVKYEGEEKITTLFAGQTIDVGTVTFSEADEGEVTITIVLDDPWEFADVSENLKVQDYEHEPSGNPSPGQFEYKKFCDPASNTCTIVVPENNYYGVHVEVGEWVPDPEFGS